MPRDGSPKLPAGAVPAEPMSIGEIANPPFAVLPKPESVFETRSARFAALAPGHQIGPYLEFLSKLTAIQHDLVAALPAPTLPAAELIDRSLDNGMPPLSPGQVELGEAADRVFTSIAGRLRDLAVNDASRAAADRILAASPADRGAMMSAVLVDEIPADAVAEHVIAAAAVQVHMTRLAAQLDVDRLQKVADGACPACGGAPVASAVVGWEGASGTRFCTCSLCATQWHVNRIQCLVCGTSEKGIAYHSLEGGPETVMGETCENCQSYVKILHQHKDGRLDPVADDVASLALDIVLGREGWQRASVNPFLSGY